MCHISYMKYAAPNHAYASDIKWDAFKNERRHDELHTTAPAADDNIACIADTALRIEMRIS